jgi:hypothetical protein
MTKKKTKREAQKLFDNLTQITESAETDDLTDSEEVCPITDMSGSAIFRATVEEAQESGEISRMKKFRFQLLHLWLTQNFPPCRVADIGGGKGFLAYLLQMSGWDATVIDPVYQDLPEKYKDITLNKRVKIPLNAKVPHINAAFEQHLARDFDLLVGMHAHGCNVKIIDAAKEYGKDFVLLPCCIIDEPLYPLPGVHWLECLADYAKQKGFTVRPFRLNFRGQNIGFYSSRS